MKPNTRLLIRFALEDGSMKSWGYDQPYYTTLEQLQKAITDDFQEYPEHTEIHLFYHNQEEQITAANAEELTTIASDWIVKQGVNL